MPNTALKQKTITGLTWSFIENISQYFLTFIIGVILARLLSPIEFGLVGMITIFTAISQSFIDSGFTNALIRKSNCTQIDYSTVFFYNLGSALFFYIVLFFCASYISDFYNQPQLTLLIRVVSLNLIISSFGLIQRTILTKRVDFKLQTRISVLSSLISGIVGILLAFYGWGVWSLVYRQLLSQLLIASFFWIWNRWTPSIVFSIESFKSMFSFGYKLLLSGLIDTIYRNLYLLIIGKYFSAADLGQYTRAEQFRNLPSSNITGIIGRVTYPVLATMQNEPEKLKSAYKKMIKSTMFLSFVLMVSMAAVAEPLVLTLIGEKWRPSIIFLQILCISGMLYPLHALNLNMLNVLGRSDLFLRLEVAKKIVVIPVIVVGIHYGILYLIWGMVATSFFAYYINSFWSGKLLNYSMKEQLFDILPSFLLAIVVGTCVYVMGEIIDLGNLGNLIAQIIFGLFLIVSICETLKLNDYIYIKITILDKIKPLMHR